MLILVIVSSGMALSHSWSVIVVSHAGQALADKIVGFLLGSGLDPARMHGQAYDGAGNMVGKTNGVAALISLQYPLALYIHCASHC